MSSQDPFLVARVERRSEKDAKRLTYHTRRTGGDLGHVDRERSNLNRVIVGSGYPWRDIKAERDRLAKINVKEKYQAMKKTRGKPAADAFLVAAKRELPKPYHHLNNEPFTEILLSASPCYFRREDQGPGEWDVERLDAFIQRAEQVLRKKFGKGLVSLTVDLDEETPHLNAWILPTITKQATGRSGVQYEVNHRAHPEFHIPDPDKKLLEGLKGKAKARRRRELQIEAGMVTGFETFQTSMAEAFADLGIQRGVKRAEADREALKNGETPKMQRHHKSPVQYRNELAREFEKQQQVTAGLEADREGAAVAKLRAEKMNAAADGKNAEAERRFRVAKQKLAKVEAFEAGLDALVSDELQYHATDGDRPARLSVNPSVSGPKRQIIETALATASDRLSSIATKIADFRTRVARRVQNHFRQKEMTWELEMSKVKHRETAADRRDIALSEREASVGDREKQALAIARGLEREKAELEARRPRSLSMADIVSRVANGEWPVATDAEQAARLREMEDVMALPQPRNRAEREAEDSRLKKLTNTGLRRCLVATESAASSLDSIPADFQHGIAILEFEAERRGFNLETGRHDPKTAKDPKRANLHRDHDLQPVQVIRKIVGERQLVRW